MCSLVTSEEHVFWKGAKGSFEFLGSLQGHSSDCCFAETWQSHRAPMSLAQTHVHMNLRDRDLSELTGSGPIPKIRFSKLLGSGLKKI